MKEDDQMKYVTNINGYINLYFKEYLDVNKLDFVDELNLEYLKEKELIEYIKNNKNPDYYAILADLYYKGKYVKEDYFEALKLLDIGIEENSIYCMYKKGCILLDSIDLKYDEAFMLISKASKTYPPAINTLAWMYSKGIGCCLDLTKTKQLFKQSADLGCKTAMLNYAKLLFSNDDIKEGLRYLNLAIENKCVSAYMTIAYYYFNGKYLKQDYRLAYKYYKLAALEDEPIAYKYLARMYRYGYYVDININTAEVLYKLAIKLGDDNSKKELANMIDEKKGVEYNDF